MLNTVQDVFDIAIRLMDEQNESSGATVNGDTKEYALRTPSLLNSLLDRCVSASEPMFETNGKRPICPKVNSMEDEIMLDERVCTGVLPYGLAALLFRGEDSEGASFFWDTFEEQLAICRLDNPASGDSTITDVYGGIEYSEFGDW